MNTTEHVSFERQVAAFLGSMAGEAPDLRGPPPSGLVGRVYARMAMTVVAAVVVVSLVGAAGTMMVTMLLHRTSNPGLDARGQTSTTISNAGFVGATGGLLSWLQGGTDNVRPGSIPVPGPNLDPGVESGSSGSGWNRWPWDGGGNHPHRDHTPPPIFGSGEPGPLSAPVILAGGKAHHHHHHHGKHHRRGHRRMDH